MSEYTILDLSNNQSGSSTSVIITPDGSSNPIYLTYWSPGMYNEHSGVIYKNTLYILDKLTTTPFLSYDFEQELSDNKWKKITVNSPTNVFKSHELAKAELPLGSFFLYDEFNTDGVNSPFNSAIGIVHNTYDVSLELDWSLLNIDPSVKVQVMSWLVSGQDGLQNTNSLSQPIEVLEYNNTGNKVEFLFNKITPGNFDELYFSNTGMKNLSGFNIPGIVHVEMSNNNLDKLHLTSPIPNTLTSFYASNNRIRSFSSKYFFPASLTNFSISGNLLEFLDLEFIKNSSISYLDLSNNRFKFMEDLKFSNIWNVNNLNLSNNVFEEVDLPESIFNSSSYINLSSNKLTQRSYENMLSKYSTIQNRTDNPIINLMDNTDVVEYTTFYSFMISKGWSVIS